jgi:uncharacterized oligopeptide transporter (OPT) family protein
MSSEEITQLKQQPPPEEENGGHQPYVPDYVTMPELTWPAVLVGAVLGIVFGASSLYLVLKVGLTVSASVPIAVLSITLFRFFSQVFGFRRATILENNIVQTTGSAGESIAFGVGVTMPVLLLLGFEMDVVRVMTVSVLGGLLGILMMIPLRRAFIVKQHGKLKYPEGTACAEVLIAGEKGGATARMVFLGFGIAFVYKFLSTANKLWATEPSTNLYDAGTRRGLRGAAVGGELSPELLGVGYLIGPRIACLMMSGAVLSYFVIGPLIATFGERLPEPVAPAQTTYALQADAGMAATVIGLVGQPGGGVTGLGILHGKAVNQGLIGNMGPADIMRTYLRYIGAGAVAAGGIISMLRALPLIISSVVSGLRDLRASRQLGKEVRRRTERDLSMWVVLFGSLGLVVAMMLIPQLGLGLNPQGLLGGLMILLFGFLFVTVSSRLTGEIGSSSNPISGMTIATLLMTCLIFWLLGRTGPLAMLTALSVAAVVCIASSNGGTTSQDLKTGYLVGATPRYQQLSILVGALTSALVIGGTMLLLNDAGTHYDTRRLPTQALIVPEGDAPRERPGRPHEDDTREYRIVHVRKGDKNNNRGANPGRYLVDDRGYAKYRADVPISREAKTMDNDQDAPPAFVAPQPRLFQTIIEGILGGRLEWGLIVIGVLVALVVELMGVSALPFAVGMYLPITSSTPIFIGGLLRWLADRLSGKSASEAEAETSPGVLLSSGYIAGGTLCGLIIAFFAFLPEVFSEALNLGRFLPAAWRPEDSTYMKVAALVMFAVLAVVLVWVGTRKAPAPGTAEERGRADNP